MDYAILNYYRIKIKYVLEVVGFHFSVGSRCSGMMYAYEAILVSWEKNLPTRLHPFDLRGRKKYISTPRKIQPFNNIVFLFG